MITRWPSVALLLLLAGTASAEVYPEPTIDELCHLAPFIVEGEWLGGNKIKVTKVHRRPKELAKVPAVLVVGKLSYHDRNAEQELPRNVVVFLTHNDAWDRWAPYAPITGHEPQPNAWGGSAGLFWFDEDNVYGYVQQENPGPYVLADGRTDSLRGIPRTIQHMRREIAEGLARVARWRAILAREDPKKKAEALAPYCLRATSPVPERLKHYYAYYACKELGKLKEAAVPVALALLKDRGPKDQIGMLTGILYDVGPAAKGALPQLLALAPRLDGESACELLHRIGDRTALPTLRAYLKHPEPRVHVAAAEALAEFRDKESYDAIRALVPDQPTEKSRFDVLRLLRVLKKLDAERTRPLLKKMARYDLGGSWNDNLQSLLRD